MDGLRCRNYAYGTAVQCGECVREGVPPATELTLTVVADSYPKATALLMDKRRQFEQQYPHVRLLIAGETQDYAWTKSRASVGERQHWVRYLMKKR